MDDPQSGGATRRPQRLVRTAQLQLPMLSAAIALLLMPLLMPLLASEPARAQAPAPPSTDALRDSIEAVLEETGTPGAGVVLFSADSIRWEGYVGLADREAERPVTDSTVFRAGSISKSFVSTAVLMAVEEGTVDLQAPVREAVPGVRFSNPWSETDPVRVAHLLEHTSGFDDLEIHEYASQSSDITLQEGLAVNPATRRSRWRPGMYYSYSNAGPPVAAYLLQERAGRRFEALVRDSIFDPLGMQAASFRRDERVRDHLAAGYAAGGETEKPYVHIALRPAGALNARPAGLARFAQMLLGRGTRDGTTLLDTASVRRMETPRTSLAARNGLGTGYALGNDASPQEGFVYRGHSGGIDGFAARYGYLPEHDRGYVVMINSQDGGARGDIADFVRAYQTRSLAPPEPPAVADVPADTLARHAGYYVSFTPRNEIARFAERLLGIVHVDTTRRGLSVSPALGAADTLLAVDARRFRAPSEPVATAVVAKDASGRTVISGDGAVVGGNLRAVSTVSVWGRWAAAGLSILFLAAPLLFALYWLPVKAFGRLNQPEPIHLRLWPLVAVVSLGGAFAMLAGGLGDPIRRLGTLSVYSAGYAALSLGYGAATLAGLWALARSRGQAHGGTWAFHACVVAAQCLVLGYLALHGLIGHRFWT